MRDEQILLKKPRTQFIIKCLNDRTGNPTWLHSVKRRYMLEYPRMEHYFDNEICRCDNVSPADNQQEISICHFNSN